MNELIPAIIGIGIVILFTILVVVGGLIEAAEKENLKKLKQKDEFHIMPLDCENTEFVVHTLRGHPEWYGEFEETDLCGGSFYGVYDKYEDIIGFFAICHWGYGEEAVLAGVWVREDMRNKGIFNRIVRFFKSTCYKCPLLTIWAEPSNETANAVYSHLFKFHHYDKVVGENLYVIRDDENYMEGEYGD